jgi:hypothetical protein
MALGLLTGFFQLVAYPSEGESWKGGGGEVLTLIADN